MVYLITHGEKCFGVNPMHTKKGIEQIERLVLIVEPCLVVVGTGARFQEIRETMIRGGRLRKDIPIKCSPFCGSADSLEADKETVTMADGGTVALKEYIGFGNDCFDAWGFIFDLPDNTLLCAGGELMIALGLGDINEKGQLFELDQEGTGKKIS